MEYLKQARRLIAKDEIQEAITLLLTNTSNQESKTEVIALQAQYKEWVNQSTLGLLSSESNYLRNGIIYGLLNHITQTQLTDNQSNKNKQIDKLEKEILRVIDKQQELSAPNSLDDNGKTLKFLQDNHQDLYNLITENAHKFKLIEDYKKKNVDQSKVLQAEIELRKRMKELTAITSKLNFQSIENEKNYEKLILEEIREIKAYHIEAQHRESNQNLLEERLKSLEKRHKRLINAGFLGLGAIAISSSFDRESVYGKGYDENGYDQNGFDYNGFNEDGYSQDHVDAFGNLDLNRNPNPESFDSSFD